MGRKVIFILLAIFSSGCGADERERPEPYVPGFPPSDKPIEVDNELRSTYDEVVKICQDSKLGVKRLCNKNLNRLKEVKLHDEPIDPDDDDIVGTCIKYKLTRVIKITRERYEVDSYRMLFLVYHELGHCIFDMPHLNSGNGIMMPSIPDETFIRTNWASLKANYLNGKEIDIQSCFLGESND